MTAYDTVYSYRNHAHDRRQHTLPMTRHPILVGTASFTDPTLLACGRYYPPHVTTPAQRLSHYASHYPLLEIDATYYALPRAEVAHGWATRTPPGFTFNIKAFRALTGHAVPASALPPDLRPAAAPDGSEVFMQQLPGNVRRELWHRFLVGIEPLRQAGKLGAVLFQFPPWLRASPRGHGYVRHCADMMAGHTLALEYRHRSWFAGSARAASLALARELGAAHVVVDSPQAGENTVPAVWEATTAELAMVRLHGRNAAAWSAASRASSGRFQYVYPPAELADLAARTRELATRARRTHVIFNTNHEDQGMVNASAFIGALGV